MADDDSKKGCGIEGDELMAGPELPGGARPYIRHTPDHQFQAGVMRPVREGEALYDGAFHLEHKDGPIYRVTDLYSKSEATLGHKGPANVTSPAFRENYDNIFGKKVAVGSA